MTRVVHFSQDFRRGKPQLGGFSRICGLTADGNDHVIVTLHSGDFGVDEWEVDHLRVVSFGIGTARVRSWSRRRVARDIGARAARWLLDHGHMPDVLFGHSQLMNFDVLSALRSALCTKVPLLWEANGIIGHQLFDGSRHPAHFWYAAQQYRVFHRADHVIAQTERSKAVIIERFRVKADRVSVVTNGFDAASVNAVKHYEKLPVPLTAGAHRAVSHPASGL